MANTVKETGANARRASDDYGDAPSRASYTLERIRADILAATLKPGQKLSFKMLTSMYQVGLSPLRESLCQLVGNGLVMLESQRGFRVTPVSREDLVDVISIRRWVEVYALELSIDRRNEQWSQEVKSALDEFTFVAAKAGDSRPINKDWQEIHRKLHFAMISACDSPTLLQFCSQIYDRFDRYRRLAVPAQAFMAATAGDHGAIARAALAGERNKAKLLLERHIDDIAEIVNAKFTPDTAGDCKH
ncbi:MAG TPA: GntR family transcriptional regulator [Burkholderiaceae bacterium]|jgi:DNA-binding GntR family transcriptional regulator|nr:GntR family transcriptional regulator [Burkholderiaceae bacterium]